MLGFLVVDEKAFTVEPEAAAALGEQGGDVLAVARQAVAGVAPWTAAGIEAALRSSLVDGLGMKPRHAFTPVRVAVTGRKVSPPLFESMELLGRERSLARIAALAGGS
jgi:glutamyl-tRNA synthetase